MRLVASLGGLPLVEGIVAAAPTVALLVALHRFHRRGLEVLFEVVRRNPRPEARLSRPLAAPPVSINALWLHAAAAAARLAGRWLVCMSSPTPTATPWGAVAVDAVSLKLLSDLHSSRDRAADLLRALRNSQELAVGSAAGVTPEAAKRQREQRLSLTAPLAPAAGWWRWVPFQSETERPHMLLFAAPCVGLAGLLAVGEAKGAATWATGLACFGALADAAALTSQLVAFDRKRDYAVPDGILCSDPEGGRGGPSNAHRWLIRAYCTAVAASLARYGIDTGDIVVRQIVAAYVHRGGDRSATSEPSTGDPTVVSGEVKVAAAGLVAALIKTLVLADFLRA